MSTPPKPTPVPAISGEPAEVTTAALSPAARDAMEEAVRFARDALSDNTRLAYASDWQNFAAWCSAAGLASLPAPPETVAAYLAVQARTYAVATLRRRLVSISKAHRIAGHTAFWAGHPVISETLRGVTRTRGRPQRRAAALTTPEIRRLVAGCGPDLAGLRDRALILLGYAAALRRSELVAVDVEHLRFDAQGLRLHIPHSKGDQAGEGEDLGIPRGQRRDTCPVRAIEAWLQASDTRFGPVFRKINRWGGVEPGRLHPDGVRQILSRRAEQAGIAGTALEPVSPHGLRAGFVTQAYKAGLRDEEIMQHSRHRDLRTMRRYVRRAKLLEDSPAKRLDL
ncbi:MULTISPECIES: site-specific integrase [Roseicella]|nr:site-specific integrase [Roseicella frigidaeris]